MKLGNLSQTAWKRSIGRELHRGERKTVRPPVWEDRCSALQKAEGDTLLWASAAAAGDSGNIGYYAALKAAGDIAAKGGRPEGVSLRLQLPVHAEEEQLKMLAAGARDACDRMQIPVTAVEGEVCPYVSRTIAVAAAAGTASESSVLPGHVYPGQEILLCGYIGLEGTLRILDEARKELGTRFIPSFLQRTAERKKDLVMPQAIEKICGIRAEEEGQEARTCVTAVRQIGSGGVLAALWELCEEIHMGFEADLYQMTLKQETVEICEFYQLNPYQMTSAGSYLIVADHADEVLEVLEKVGARAGRLGVIKAQNARVITSGEETRYLDRPAPDELMRWWEQRQKMEG